MATATANKRLKELIVYIASQCDGDETFGATKLNKILFFADFFYYRQKRESISGQKYIHMPFGPVPEAMETVQKQMLGKDIAYAFSQSGPYMQKRVVALREPDLSGFEPEMIGFLTTIINQVCVDNKISATKLSDLSHDYVGWKITKIGEEIPYQSVFLKRFSKQQLTPDLTERAKELYQEITQAHARPKEVVAA